LVSYWQMEKHPEGEGEETQKVEVVGEEKE
jgi:hypothetical protein